MSLSHAERDNSQNDGQIVQILSWSDLVTDYNIYQDYRYKLTVNIAGPSSADLRVTITDGNAAVFDDMDNVENTVSFGEEKWYPF